MKSIAIDFDGVIHKYSKGWHDGSIYDETIDGWVEAIIRLQRAGYAVFIFSTRDPDQIVEWYYRDFLINHPSAFEMQKILGSQVFWNNDKVVGVTGRKLEAIAYIDDRAVRFEGSWEIIDNLLKGGDQ